MVSELLVLQKADNAVGSDSCLEGVQLTLLGLDSLIIVWGKLTMKRRLSQRPVLKGGGWGLGDN